MEKDFTLRIVKTPHFGIGADHINGAPIVIPNVTEKYKIEILFGRHSTQWRNILESDLFKFDRHQSIKNVLGNNVFDTPSQAKAFIAAINEYFSCNEDVVYEEKPWIK